MRLWSQPFATVRNRPQPFATVRAIPVWPCLWEVLQRWSLFGGFRRVVASFRVAGVALRDIQTCSGTCRKSFCLAGRNTFATFSEDVLQFSWQAQHFGRVHRHFSWQAQHFRRVVLRVFCKSHWRGASVATRCKFRGSRGILYDVLKIDGSLARNMDFEVANFQVLRKTPRKTSIFEATKCENWRKSRTKCWFFCIHVVLSRVAGFPVASPCLWGKLENLSFSNVSKQVVMLFCVADVVLSDIPTCLMMFTKFQNWRKSRRKCFVLVLPRVSSRVSRFLWRSPCLWGKLENMSYSNVSKQVVMSFCVAGRGTL